MTLCQNKFLNFVQILLIHIKSVGTYKECKQKLCIMPILHNYY